MLPTLCETGVKYFIRSSLKELHHEREQRINTIFNITMALTFITVVGGFLMYRYKGKLSVEEKQVRSRQKQEYIVGKLQKLAAIRRDKITNLPEF